LTSLPSKNSSTTSLPSRSKLRTLNSSLEWVWTCSILSIVKMKLRGWPLISLLWRQKIKQFRRKRLMVVKRRRRDRFRLRPSLIRLYRQMLGRWVSLWRGCKKRLNSNRPTVHNPKLSPQISVSSPKSKDQKVQTLQSSRETFSPQKNPISLMKKTIKGFSNLRPKQRCHSRKWRKTQVKSWRRI
jgi:hypothetical protein